MRILLVDDEREFVSALAERLSMRGYETEWTSTGKEALELVEAKEFDLAILDLKMPMISGIELRKRMAEMRPDLRFMFISGHGAADEDLCAGDAAKDCYVIKPVSIENLMAKIKTIFPE